MICLRIIFTRNKKIVCHSLAWGSLFFLLTFTQPLKQESVLTDQQPVFITAVEQTTVRIDGDQLRFTGQTKNQNNQTEEIVVTYRFSEQEEKERWQTKEMPEMLKITGGLKQPSTARNFNQFDYRAYLKRKQIYWTLKAEKIEPAEAHQSLYSLAYQIDKLRSDFFNFIDPPIFSIFFCADFDAKLASILILSLISPVPKIFNLIDFLLINLCFFNNSEFKMSSALMVFLSI